MDIELLFFEVFWEIVNLPIKYNSGAQNNICWGLYVVICEQWIMREVPQGTFKKHNALSNTDKYYYLQLPVSAVLKEQLDSIY